MIEELYGSAITVLRAASNQQPFKPIYADTRETARGLADNGYLEPVGQDEYEITQKALDFLTKKPLAIPRARAKTNAPHQARKQRRPTQKPQPQSVQKAFRPVAFVRLRQRQKDMLRFIDKYSQEMGFPPSYREIGEGVGIPSTSVILYNVGQLVAFGWLQRTEGVSRSLCLAQELPGSKTKNDIRVIHGVLTITVNVASRPSEIIDSAQAAIKCLQVLIAETQAGGSAKV